MNKNELVEALEKETGMTKKDSKLALEGLINIIQTSVAKNKKITITGFGSFEQRKTKARAGINPSTGEAIKIKASKKPAFKAGKSFKDLVKG